MPQMKTLRQFKKPQLNPNAIALQKEIASNPSVIKNAPHFLKNAIKIATALSLSLISFFYQAFKIFKGY